MRKDIIACFLLIFVLVFYSCSNPTGPDGQLMLSISNVSCTEAWLNLKTGNLALPANIVVNKNGNRFFSFTLINSDTTIYDSTLSPNQTYTYQIVNNSQTKSESVTVKTLDTTSSNFTWQKFSFGGNAGNCSFYDCTIVNDNLAYAVGEVYLNDSTGQQNYQPYNLAVWNGTNWKLQKLNYNGFPPVIHSVFAINAQNIWFDPWFHWNGQNIQELPIDTVFFGVGINKMWGNENGELYIVGNNGTIAYSSNYGISWYKLNSGTNNNITDVWGSTMNTEEMIYCITHDQYGTNNSEIISIQNNEATITPFNEDNLALSIWTPNKNIIYVGGGNGLFKYANNNWKKINYNNSGYVGEIRGNASNDFFISGGFGLAAHFNGSLWKVYNDISLNAGNYNSVSMKDNIVLLVGDNYGKAVITLGRRN